MIGCSLSDEYEGYLASRTLCGACTYPDWDQTQGDVTEVCEISGGIILGLNEPVDLYVWEARLTPSTVEVNSPNYILPSLESPFDTLDEELSIDEKIKKLIDFLRDESKIPFARELVSKLNFLIDVVNEDPDEDSISFNSMRYFISFLQTVKNLKCPSVALTPSNEIHAQWRAGAKRHFATVFFSSGEVQFVIFTPNSGNPAVTDRFSGRTTVESLLENIQPHKVLDWATN